MIKLASYEDKPLVYEMWKAVFEDTDEYMDLFFTDKYKPENTLIYFENGVAAASLQMQLYYITFYGQKIPFYYLVGLCTLPQYRRRGYMEQLIDRSHQIMAERGIPLSILVPAEDWLFGFYNRYGYEQVFEKDEENIPIKTIFDQYPDIHDAYKAFDKFQKTDFTVQKSFEDFCTIAKDYCFDSCPPKYNLSAMARVINTEYLLSVYASANTTCKFSIEVNDSIYCIADGKCCRVEDVETDLRVDFRMLVRLLFGYKTNELSEELSLIFPLHHPKINLMLE